MKKEFSGMDCQECGAHDYYFKCRSCVSNELQKAKKEVFDDFEKKLNYMLAYNCNCELNNKCDKNVFFIELKKKHLKE